MNIISHEIHYILISGVPVPEHQPSRRPLPRAGPLQRQLRRRTHKLRTRGQRLVSETGRTARLHLYGQH